MASHDRSSDAGVARGPTMLARIAVMLTLNRGNVRELAGKHITGRGESSYAGLSTIRRLLNSEILNSPSRFQLRDQPARLPATTGPGL